MSNKDKHIIISNEFPELPGTQINILPTDNISGAIGGIINDNSFLKVETNAIDIGLVPHITINNGKSQLSYNNFSNIKGAGITINNGTAEVLSSVNNIDENYKNYNYTENATDQNFPNYSVGYTAEFRNIISGNQFSTQYNNLPYFTGILLNDGNKPFWSELNDGYVLKDFSCNLNSLDIYHSISKENLKIFNFDRANISEETLNSIQLTNLTGSVSSIIKDFSVNTYISDQYGHIYKIDNISEDYTSMKLLLDGKKYIFDIIPKNLNGHTIDIKFDNEIAQKLNINNFENGYINLSGNTINNITNILNNNSEILFDNVTFKQNVSGLNCNNLTFKKCNFTANVVFDNCNVKIFNSRLNSTLSGINNSQIYVKDSISTQTLKCQGLSNSQITWTSNNLINNNYKSYIASGNVNLDLSGLISSSLYSGVELSNQNALVNHFHTYPEYLIPNQYINTASITSGYLDTLPIGSVIFWPELVRKATCDSDTIDDTNKRNKNIPSELSSKNYVCYTPLLTGSYERCNGESLRDSEDKHVIYALIRNNFDITHTGIVKPNLVSRYLLNNVSNDKFNEVYPFYKYTVGNNINQTIQFRYVARWASGFGQEHNGSVERDHEVIIENNRLTLNAYYKSKGRKGEDPNFRGGQCVIFAIDIPSSNFDEFISNKNIVFQGYSTTCIYDTDGTITSGNPENLCGIKLINYECLQALFVSQKANLNETFGLYGDPIKMESESNRPDESINPDILSAEFDVELGDWFILHRNDSEGSDLSAPIRRISYFNFSNKTTWRDNSLDFIYDNNYNLWELDGSTLKDNLNTYKFSKDNYYRFYCMAYINNIKSTRKNLTILNFNIVNKDDNSSIYAFYIFGSNAYGNGVGNWHYDHSYNVFYSYAINGNRIW